MSVRVEVVTPCEHDQWNPHRSGDGEIVASSDGAEIMAVICHGATRKAFTEWPPEAIEAAARAMNAYSLGREQTDDEWQSYWNTQSGASFRDQVALGLAAAWGHITGDNK